MGVLEKITANMELTELKKFKLQKAILAMMLEWKHLEEYMDSTQHSFQECLDELQLKEKYLNSVHESAVESNKEMDSIRVSIEGKIKELDDKEREFLVFRDEQLNALDLKEKQLGLIGKSIEERMKLVELREEKFAAKQKAVEGIFKKFKFKEKQFEDIQKSVEERIEEINSKGMLLEKHCKELESKEKELSDRAREIESMAKQINIKNVELVRKKMAVYSNDASTDASAHQTESSKQKATELPKVAFSEQGCQAPQKSKAPVTTKIVVVKATAKATPSNPAANQTGKKRQAPDSSHNSNRSVRSRGEGGEKESGQPRENASRPHSRVLSGLLKRRAAEAARDKQVVTMVAKLSKLEEEKKNLSSQLDFAQGTEKSLKDKICVLLKQIEEKAEHAAMPAKEQKLRDEIFQNKENSFKQSLT